MPKRASKKKSVGADVRKLKAGGVDSPARQSSLLTSAPTRREGLLVIRNTQREQALDVRLLRAVTKHVLHDLLGQRHYALCFHFVSARRMAELNWTFLRHEGPTDVITFNEGEEWGLPAPADGDGANGGLLGEIFICPAVGKTQAKEFKTTWQSETARYLIHGLLHLLGYDDGNHAQRKVMKKEENRLLYLVAQQFPLARLGRRAVSPQGKRA